MGELEKVWLKALERHKPGTPLPPCPACGGVMEFWDAWLVTGESCTACGFSSCEGSGVLAPDPYQGV